MNLRTNICLLYLILIVLFTYCSPVSYTSSSGDNKVLEFANMSYEPSIKTVLFEVMPDNSSGQWQPAIIPADGSKRLKLSFDDLSPDIENYMLRLVYMTSNWEDSRLPSVDYLSDYNEFRFNQYFMSLDTRIPYVHYTIDIPPVKVSGNYLAVVYREGNENDIVLSKRFVVYENISQISPPDQQRALSQFSGHQIDFNVTYNSRVVRDPFLNLKATVRQNYRWDNAIYQLNPSQIRNEINQARFQYFDKTNRFEPGNEYRFFDMKSVISPGQFIVGMDRESDTIQAKISTDHSRNGLAYTFYRDLNGGFQIRNYDASNSIYFSEYVEVEFLLETDQLSINDEVYVSGLFSDYRMDSTYRLKPENGGKYRNNLLMKQGYYDYIYLVKSPEKPPLFLEGSHINTENVYEVLVYDTDPVNRYHRCIGYFQFGLNVRSR